MFVLKFKNKFRSKQQHTIEQINEPTRKWKQVQENITKVGIATYPLYSKQCNFKFAQEKGYKVAWENTKIVRKESIWIEISDP